MVTTDINPHAAVATMATGKRNGISIDTVETSLVQGLLPRMRHSIDILCFNPPYAVTPSSEIAGNGIEVSWAGGIDGREVINATLPFVKVRQTHWIHCHFLFTSSHMLSVGIAE
jgi:release factor glutamine methyltransferase